MGISKTDLFTDRQNGLASIFKALGHPARIAILDHLLKAEACINGDLVDETGLAQPTISQHLKELKTLGIIQGSIEGAKMSYCINPDKWQEIKSSLQSFFESFSNPNSCC